jgi:hypothetical protein
MILVIGFVIKQVFILIPSAEVSTLETLEVTRALEK